VQPWLQSQVRLFLSLLLLPLAPPAPQPLHRRQQQWLLHHRSQLVPLVVNHPGQLLCLYKDQEVAKDAGVLALHLLLPLPRMRSLGGP
jgi:hypothetical protein